MKTGKRKSSKRKEAMKYFLCLIAIVFLLTACSSDDGDDGISGTGFDIEGTAATGDPIANAAVLVIDQAANTQSATTGSDGKFSITDVTGDGPFLMRVDPGTGKYFYSVAHRDGDTTITRNIHPYTDLMVRNWFATQGLEIDTVFNGPGTIPTLPTLTEITAIEAEINSVIAEVLKNFQVASDVDLLATPFDADQTGFDLFLLNNPVIINDNKITVIANSIEQEIQGIVTDAVNLNFDFTSDIDNLPSIPNNVRAFDVGFTAISISWETSSDDKGVANYKVYRNGDFIATTPYPVYSDEGLEIYNTYSYEVESVDSQGQSSAKSMVSNSITLGALAQTLPLPPPSLQATVMEDDVLLQWSQTRIQAIYSFRILRGATCDTMKEIANVTTTSYTDFNLTGAADYCYKVVSSGVGGGELAASEETTVTVATTTLESSSALD